MSRFCSPRPRLCALLLSACSLSLACGDSFSSLDAVRQGQGAEYAMGLSPNYGRQGTQVVLTVVHFEPALQAMLDAADSYVLDVEFGEVGDGVHLEAYGKNEQGQLQLEVWISGVAPVQELHPAIVFAVGDRRIVTRASFYVIAALAS